MDEERVILSCVPIHILNDKMQPISIGTGCIFEENDCDYIFTVFHVANINNGIFSILYEYVPEKGPMYLQIKGGRFNYIKTINLKNGVSENLEFAYAEIPKLNYYYQELSYPDTIKKSLLRKKYKFNNINVPRKNIDYAFCGHIKPTIIGNYAFETINMCHFDYRFKETKDWYHLFETPVKHPGHEYYKGCSGAPVIDNDENLVSLIVRGDISTNEIYGIDLKRILSIIIGEIDLNKQGHST